VLTLRCRITCLLGYEIGHFELRTGHFELRTGHFEVSDYLLMGYEIGRFGVQKCSVWGTEVLSLGYESAQFGVRTGHFGVRKDLLESRLRAYFRRVNSLFRCSRSIDSLAVCPWTLWGTRLATLRCRSAHFEVSKCSVWGTDWPPWGTEGSARVTPQTYFRSVNRPFQSIRGIDIIGSLSLDALGYGVLSLGYGLATLGCQSAHFEVSKCSL
jgi:hypothetical protein